MGFHAARLLHPLALKACIFSYEPFAWRGGQVLEVWKGKGDPAQCSSHRDVVLSDSMSKIYHGIGGSRVVDRYH
eukprot:2509583-Alexandrium_andersonii.AAC.1